MTALGWLGAGVLLIAVVHSKITAVQCLQRGRAIASGQPRGPQARVGCTGLLCLTILFMADELTKSCFEPLLS